MHAGASAFLGSAESTRFRRYGGRAGSLISPSCAHGSQGTGSFPPTVEDGTTLRMDAGLLADLARLIGKLPVLLRKQGLSRARLGCRAGPRRRLQEPSCKGPRRHAALGLLVGRIAPASRSLKPPGPFAALIDPKADRVAPGPSRSLPRPRETSTAFAAPASTGTGFRSRPPDARVAIGRSVQRFLTRAAFPGLVPYRFRSHPAGAACEAPPLQSDACFTSCQRA